MGLPQVEQVCFEKDAFIEFLNILYKKHETESIDWIKDMGKAYGSSLVAKFSQYIMLSSELKREEQMSIHMKSINRLGWGTYEFTKMDWSVPEFEVEYTNNIFLEECKNGNNTICFFVRGVLTGALEEITNTILDVELKECIIRGDEKCVFRIKPKEIIL